MKSRTKIVATQLEEAVELVKRNDPLAALLILENLYKSNQDDEEINCALGITHIKLNQHSLAETCFQRAISINNKNPTAHFYMAELFSAKGDSERALESYKKAIHPHPRTSHNAVIYFKIAVILQKKNYIDQAMVNYMNSLRINPDNAVAHYNTGIIYHSKNQLKEAEKALERAITIKQDYFIALNNLASLILEQGRSEEAETLYLKALHIKPGSAGVMLNIANVLHSRHQYHEAIAYYRKLAVIDPDNFLIWRQMGSAYKALKKKDEAINCYKRALAIKPDSSEVGYQLAAIDINDATTPDTAPPDYVASVFDGYADKFDKHLVEILIYRTPSHIFKALYPFIKDKEKLLDIMDLGCGTGLCGKLFTTYANKLTGVDLSPKMLEKAREIGCYDELIVGDLLPSLEPGVSHYNLILSADVFVYIGNLKEIFLACGKALRKCGLFAFSIEAETGSEEYVLQESARYAHSKEYIRSLSELAGLAEVRFEKVVLRTENDNPVNGYVVVLEKSSISLDT